MKVKELISSLEKFDPESEICEVNYEWGYPRYFKFEISPYVVNVIKSCVYNSFAYYRDGREDESEKIVLIGMSNK